MAACVATWNSCPFCIGAHSSVAVRGIERNVVDAVLSNYRSAPISEKLKAAIAFIEKITKAPDELTAADAHLAIGAGISREELEDAAAVAALFAIVTRYANALDFDIPSPSDFDKAGGMLLRRGYA
jgi:alkylhydroperoxidase family enzyme